MRPSKPSLRWILAVSTLIPLFGAAAQAGTLSLDPPLGEHMLLQRDRPISLQGQAAPGATVSARLAGLSGRAQADAQGHWRLELGALPAGGPFSLTLSAGGETLALDDVLVGELWVASGQSNMEWALDKADDAAAELALAQHPRLRLYSVARQLPPWRGPGLGGAWQACTPEGARDFSAVAYYFGAELLRRLDVPIGIVAAPWSGTPGEAWVPAEALAAEPGLALVGQRWKARPEAEQRMYAHGWGFWLEFRGLQALPAAGSSTPPLDLAVGGWKSYQAEGSTTTVRAGRYEGTLIPGAWTAAEGAFVGGPVDLSGYERVEFQARGNSSFDLAFGQADVMDGDCYAGAPVQARDGWQSFTIPLRTLQQQGWGQARRLTLEKLSAVKFRIRQPNQFPDQPGLLFDAMIRPLTALHPRGALWYQGEANLDRADEYGLLLKTLVQGWRQAFADPGLAFLVALPDFGAPGRVTGWPVLRQAQADVLDLPGTGLAVTLGLGDGEAWHPTHKKPVGQRLAWEALRVSYGQAEARGRGPALAGIERRGSTLRLRFAAGMRTSDGKAPAAFELAGEGGAFAPAAATIHGDEVRLALPAGGAAWGRLQWSDHPQNLLTDAQGLPVAPFRFAVPPPGP